MVLNESMQGFNARNPFVIRCSNVIYDNDRLILSITKNCIRNTILVTVMLILLIPSTILYGVVLFRPSTDINSFLSVGMLIINSFLLAMIGVHIMAVVLFMRKGVKSHSRTIALEMLDAVKNDTLLINNEKVLDATSILLSFQGLLEAFADFFDMDWKFVVSGLEIGRAHV